MERLTTAAARNIFYGGSVFFFVVFALLVGNSYVQARVMEQTHPISADVARGKRIWEKKACFDCHTLCWRGRAVRAGTRQGLDQVRRRQGPGRDRRHASRPGSPRSRPARKAGIRCRSSISPTPTCTTWSASCAGRAQVDTQNWPAARAEVTRPSAFKATPMKYASQSVALPYFSSARSHLRAATRLRPRRRGHVCRAEPDPAGPPALQRRAR